MSTYTRVDAVDVAVGDVIEVSPGAAWRKVTENRTPTHPLAEAAGGVVLETVLWMDGRRMPASTILPPAQVVVVRTAAEEAAALVDAEPEPIRCPTAATLPDGTAHTVTGCGSTNVRQDDAEPNLYDCLDCGIWFDPAKETRDLERSSATPPAEPGEEDTGEAYQCLKCGRVWSTAKLWKVCRDSH